LGFLRVCGIRSAVPPDAITRLCIQLAQTLLANGSAINGDQELLPAIYRCGAVDRAGSCISGTNGGTDLLIILLTVFTRRWLSSCLSLPNPF